MHCTCNDCYCRACYLFWAFFWVIRWRPELAKISDPLVNPWDSKLCKYASFCLWFIAFVSSLIGYSVWTRPLVLLFSISFGTHYFLFGVYIWAKSSELQASFTGQATSCWLSDSLAPAPPPSVERFLMTVEDCSDWPPIAVLLLSCEMTMFKWETLLGY